MPRVGSTDAPRLTKARKREAKVFFKFLERYFDDAGFEEDEDKKECLADNLPPNITDYSKMKESWESNSYIDVKKALLAALTDDSEETTY